MILLEPLAAGVIGKAFAAGVCPAKPLVEDSDAEDYHFADFKDGTTQLIAKSSGPLTILWKETVTGGPGVEAWAVIRFSPGGGQIRQFEMKDTVEEKQWDFDVKGLAYYLEWDEVLGDWKHEAGDPTAEVWGDRFLHGVAFGDDGLAGLGWEIASPAGSINPAINGGSSKGARPSSSSTSLNREAYCKDRMARPRAARAMPGRST